MEMNEIFGTTENKTEGTKKTRKPAVKKAAAPKTAAKKAEPKKTETVKTQEAAVEVKAEKKIEPAKTEVKQAKKTTAAKKPAVKKAAAKKPAAPRKTSIKKEVFIQYYENQADEETLFEKVLADCKEQNIAVKDIKMYLKPEDNACYYVVNGNIAGKVDLF
ncbi:MAG: DUF6465 family protein [Eubacteriales bacterium]|nr:DUF6465 family protein [Eubacteriales bacterium]